MIMIIIISRFHVNPNFCYADSCRNYFFLQELYQTCNPRMSWMWKAGSWQHRIHSQVVPPSSLQTNILNGEGWNMVIYATGFFCFCPTVFTEGRKRKMCAYITPTNIIKGGRKGEGRPPTKRRGKGRRCTHII